MSDQEPSDDATDKIFQDWVGSLPKADGDGSTDPEREKGWLDEGGTEREKEWLDEGGTEREKEWLDEGGTEREQAWRDEYKPVEDSESEEE